MRGEGAWVYDQDGKRYLDLDAGRPGRSTSGTAARSWPRRPTTRCAGCAYFTPMSFTNVPAMTLAERLAAVAPGDVRRFTFECDGSEAVESAMKLARHYHYYRDKARFKILGAAAPTTASTGSHPRARDRHAHAPGDGASRPLAAFTRVALLLPLPAPHELTRRSATSPARAK